MFADLETHFSDQPQAHVHQATGGEPRAQLSDADCAYDYCLAGKATLTLRSAKTGVRFTYQVKKIPDSNDRWFVSLLSGPDNTSDYTYLGLLQSMHGQGFMLRLTAKSKMRDDSAPVVAFRFFARAVLCQRQMPASLEVFHEGRCGRCGRVLTVPESIQRGIGPECATRM